MTKFFRDPVNCLFLWTSDRRDAILINGLYIRVNRFFSSPGSVSQICLNVGHIIGNIKQIMDQFTNHKRLSKTPNIKHTDPEKRALLLAGNRRGAVVPIKVSKPDGRGWETKWINAFCPRGFTAISLPDPVLGSRSIRLPLVRTADPRKGNKDPADLKRWPCDQRQLQDDL